jgi:hypothetical protein
MKFVGHAIVCAISEPDCGDCRGRARLKAQVLIVHGQASAAQVVPSLLGTDYLQTTLMLSYPAALLADVPLSKSRNSIMDDPLAVTSALNVLQLVVFLLTNEVELARSVLPLRLYLTDAVAEVELVL